jgi:hypothetical protein
MFPGRCCFFVLSQLFEESVEREALRRLIYSMAALSPVPFPALLRKLTRRLFPCSHNMLDAVAGRSIADGLRGCSTLRGLSLGYVYLFPPPTPATDAPFHLLLIRIPPLLCPEASLVSGC